MKTKAILTAILLLVAGVIARAENGWDIQANTNGSVTTFTISRTNTAVAETVYYRLVNLSAFAGEHYKVTNVNGTNKSTAAQQTDALSGTFTFAAGDTDSRTIQVTETSASTNAFKYQTGTERSYKLEVTEIGGFLLADCTRSFTTGTSFNGSYVNKSVTDLVYFQSGSVKSDSGNKYLDVAHSGTNGIEKMIDDGYDYNDNTLCTVSTGTLYNNNSDLRTWLNSLSYKMYATVYFQQREVNDGYQYIQILADNASTYDGKDGDGKIDNGPTKSLYKAAFILTKTENVCTSWKYQAFPHKTDDHTSSTEFDYSDSYLYAQAFKNSSYKSTTSGSLVLAPTVNDINVRFDANGSDEDTWYLKNLKVRLALVDASAPTVSAVSVAPGRHSKGNTVYVSVAFDEIVKVTGTPTLSTNNNWVSLSYEAGSGSNVLTFSGTIDKNATGNLVVSGFSGTITDLAGNAPSSITSGSLCSLDASYAYSITYDLDEGSVASANPSTYTYETATITLNNPTRTTYYFNGWTGSNGNTPQTTVKITSGSHGNRSYTANWTPVWTGSGSQGDPYTITTTEGLDLLAQYVNGGNDCSGVYFQLGNDITYTYTDAWNNSSSTENNYTAIGRPNNYFKGKFDGQGHTVSGIRVYNYSSWHQGLFGIVASGGTVKRVCLSDTRISGDYRVGGIVGTNYGIIEDCTVADDVCISADQSSISHHGGIAGCNDETMRRCISRATLSMKNGSTDCNGFGGIVGFNNADNNATITDCIADGVVIPDVKGRGAIVGYNKGDDNKLTSNYYHNCKVASNSGTASGVGKGNSQGSTETSDVAGAQPLYAITLGSNVTISRSASATLPGGDNVTYTDGATISGTEYYVSGATIPFGYSGGTTGCEVFYSATAGTISGSTLTMPSADVTVTATLNVPYIDADGNLQTCIAPTEITTGRTSFGSYSNDEAWYYVGADQSFTDRVTFNDKAVHIILCDGTTFKVRTVTVYQSIQVPYGSLAVYGQRGSTGKIDAESDSKGCIAINGGNFDLNGGVISARSYDSPAIVSEGIITIRRGNVTARGGNRGISTASDINILGGTVVATYTNYYDDAYWSTLWSTNGNINILGGSFTDNSSRTNGILAGKSGDTFGTNIITLGWSTTADRIKAKQYRCATLKVADGQTLYDGNTPYSGTLTDEQKAAIANKTLAPYPGASSGASPVIVRKASLAGQERYWATFYSDTRYALPAGAQAFIMKNDHVLYCLGDGSIIPANCAVVIMADTSALTNPTVASGIVTLTPTSAAEPVVSGNILQGTSAETAAPAGARVLSKVSDTFGFFEFTGEIPANKAYYVE